MRPRVTVSALALLAALTVAPRPAAADDPCPQVPGQKATLEQAEALRALGEYACAADEYERFAQAPPRSDRATNALGGAIDLRVGLGDSMSAKKDFDELMNRLHGEPDRGLVDLVLDVARALSADARWPEVERFLGVRRSVAAKGSSSQQVQFQQMMARSLAKQGKSASADAAYLRLTKVSPSSFRQELPEINLVDDDGYVAPRPRDPAYGAVAEAKLHFADQARDRALKLTIRKGDAASLRAKRAAVASVERAYSGVLYWSSWPISAVAAAGSLARVRSQLWAQTYLAMGPEEAAAEEKLARKANRDCVELSTEVRIADAGTRACVAWLDRHRFEPFPALHELAPAPRRQGEVAAEPGGWVWR
jgi:tetratricopeptide (TPR) repeat protein